MGYYIETDSATNKAAWLVKNARGVIVPGPVPAPAPDIIPVVVMHNECFEAAGIAFNAQELASFAHPDGRRKEYLLVPREEVVRLCPYVESKLAW